MIFQFGAILPSIPYLISGVGVTLQYTLVSLVLGLVLGIFVAMCKISSSQLIRRGANFYTSIFRGTPLLLQLTLVYYGLPQVSGYPITAFEAGILAFSLNSAAYISEIIRAGINAVDKGQFEAVQALGIPYARGMKDIILPQAIRNILPALVNEMVDLLKESSLVSVIGEADLLRRVHLVAAEKYLYFEPLIVVAIVYYVLVMLFSSCAKLLEKKLARHG